MKTFVYRLCITKTVYLTSFKFLQSEVESTGMLVSWSFLGALFITLSVCLLRTYSIGFRNAATFILWSLMCFPVLR